MLTAETVPAQLSMDGLLDRTSVRSPHGFHIIKLLEKPIALVY